MTDTRNPLRRRGVAALTGLALLLAALLGTGSALAAPGHGPPATTSDTPDPTQLQPPQVTVLKNGRHLADGLIFIGPKPAPGATAPSGQTGPEIVDNQGRPVWFNPIAAAGHRHRLPRPALPRQARPHLVAGQEHRRPRPRRGLRRHRSTATTSRSRRVDAGNGLDGRPARVPPDAAGHGADHDLPPGPVRPLLGRRPGDGTVFDGVVQEVDVATGKVLFEWHSLDHVPLSDSYQPVPTSAEHALRLLPHQLGQPRHRRQPADLRPPHLDRLQGRPQDGRRHLAARRQGAATSSSAPASSSPGSTTPCRRAPTRSASSTTSRTGRRSCPRSRVIRVHLDLKAKTATLVSSIEHPDGLSARLAGQRPAAARRRHLRRLGPARPLLRVRLQRQPALRRRPAAPATTATAPTARPGSGSPTPTRPPTARALRRQPRHRRRDLERRDRGRPLGRARRPPPTGLHPAGSARWNGLDTTIDAHTHSPYVEVLALDDRGRPIGRSQPVPVSD